MIFVARLLSSFVAQQSSYLPKFLWCAIPRRFRPCRLQSQQIQRLRQRLPFCWHRSEPLFPAWAPWRLPRQQRLETRWQLTRPECKMLERLTWYRRHGWTLFSGTSSKVLVSWLVKSTRVICRSFLEIGVRLLFCDFACARRIVGDHYLARIAIRSHASKSRLTLWFSKRRNWYVTGFS